MSSAKNIEQLAFVSKSFLLKEFDNLFLSLFSKHELYIEVIRIIAQHRYGIGQEELLNSMPKSLRGESGKRYYNLYKIQVS